METKEKNEKIEKKKKGVENVYFSKEILLKKGKKGWNIEIEFTNENGKIKGIIQKHHIEDLKAILLAWETMMIKKEEEDNII
jgi:hypothetical protein